MKSPMNNIKQKDRYQNQKEKEKDQKNEKKPQNTPSQEREILSNNPPIPMANMYPPHPQFYPPSPYMYSMPKMPPMPMPHMQHGLYPPSFGIPPFIHQGQQYPYNAPMPMPLPPQYAMNNSMNPSMMNSLNPSLNPSMGPMNSSMNNHMPYHMQNQMGQMMQPMPNQIPSNVMMHNMNGGHIPTLASQNNQPIQMKDLNNQYKINQPIAKPSPPATRDFSNDRQSDNMYKPNMNKPPVNGSYQIQNMPNYQSYQGNGPNNQNYQPAQNNYYQNYNQLPEKPKETVAPIEIKVDKKKIYIEELRKQMKKTIKSFAIQEQQQILQVLRNITKYWNRKNTGTQQNSNSIQSSLQKTVDQMTTNAYQSGIAKLQKWLQCDNEEKKEGINKLMSSLQMKDILSKLKEKRLAKKLIGEQEHIKIKKIVEQLVKDPRKMIH